MTHKIPGSTKWTLAFVAAALFIAISANITYGVTDKLTASIGFNTTQGFGPTWEGLVVHTVVFLLLFRLILALLF